MAIPTNTTSLENQKFLESTTTAEQVGVVVINPDGTNINGPSATGSIAKTEDSVAASGDVGAMILSVRRDTAAASGADGDYSTVNTDSSGALWSRELNAPGYEDNTNGVAKTEQRFSYSHIATATTTAVKSASGFLHAITVNTTAAGAITIYDNTAGSGTIIGIIKASVVEQTFTFNVSFATGLTIVTAGASDLTVSYR